MMAEENGAGWLPTARPEVQAAAKAAGVVGCHILELYSPLGWLSWEEIARGLEGALGNDAAPILVFEHIAPSNAAISKKQSACCHQFARGS